MDFFRLATVPLLGQVGSRLRVSDRVTGEKFVKSGMSFIVWVPPCPLLGRGREYVLVISCCSCVSMDHSVLWFVCNRLIRGQIQVSSELPNRRVNCVFAIYVLRRQFLVSVFLGNNFCLAVLNS
jgi:hypothetical protein